MILRALKVVATFALLVAGFLGYQRFFGVVSSRFIPESALIEVPRFAPVAGPQDLRALPPSFSQARAMEWAKTAFGPDHWASQPELTIRYYNAESGYWIYAGDYRRQPDGRRVEFFPFAVVLSAKDGRGYRSITGDRAFVDFAEPFDPFKPREKPARVSQARIDGEVVVRDYRDGGRGDLIIGPLAYLEYNEKDLQIRTTDTPVTIRDRSLMVTCVGIVIDLLPSTSAAADGRARKESAVGFDGARGLRLLRDVRIVHEDVGRSGMLPGARSGSPADDKAARTPFELACDGEAKIDLPQASSRPAGSTVPAQAPPPIVARFNRNVRVKRGDPLPDQLNCDDLVVNLVRSRRGAPAESGGDSFADLEIHDATASGHGVWLQSPAQGFKALGQQLIFRKNGEGGLDQTYFRADTATGLRIWKTEVVRAGPDAGKVTSETTIETVDATIFQGGGPADAPGGSPMTVVARGPGRLETRPSPDKPAERVATWQDVLTLKSEADGRRVLTLKGRPTFHDRAQARIEAKDSLVVSLRPRPRPIEAAGPPRFDPWLGDDAVYAPLPEGPAGASDESMTGSTVLEWVRALDDVRLVAASAMPGAVEADGRAVPGRRAMTARKRLDVVFDRPPAPPGVVRGLVAPSVGTPTTTPVPAPAATAAPAVAANAPAERPAEPGMDVEADTVWARVSPPGGSSRWEAREVYLRGGVHVRRDPERDQALGTEVTGDAVDLVGKGENRYEVRAHGTPERPAEVVSDTFQIVGPRLTLDQEADTAAVIGPGVLTHLIDGRSSPLVGGANPSVVAEGDAPRRRPLVISWKTEMHFDGRPAGPDGRPAPGQARFLGGVEATIDDAKITGEELEAHLDRPIALARPIARDADADPDAPESRPQIVKIQARRNVTVANRKVDPSTGGLLELQTIRGHDILYDQPRRIFTALGPGIVRLYKRGGDDVAGPLAMPGNRRVTPASGRPAEARVAAPMELTKVTYRVGMNGRFEGPPDRPADGDRIATFRGDVQVLNAKVADESVDLSLDRPPAEFVALTSEYLRVESQPPPQAAAGASPAPARTRMMAQGGDREATARTQEATVVGDRIVYDSDTGVFQVSGEQGREVNVARQTAPGQPASVTNAQAVRYNTRSGEIVAVKPELITFVDMRVRPGSRAGFVGPPDRDPQPKKEPRAPLKRIDRSNKERRTFSGGQ